MTAKVDPRRGGAGAILSHCVGTHHSPRRPLPPSRITCDPSPPGCEGGVAGVALALALLFTAGDFGRLPGWRPRRGCVEFRLQHRLCFRPTPVDIPPSIRASALPSPCCAVGIAGSQGPSPPPRRSLFRRTTPPPADDIGRCTVFAVRRGVTVPYSAAIVGTQLRRARPVHKTHLVAAHRFAS